MHSAGAMKGVYVDASMSSIRLISKPVVLAHRHGARKTVLRTEEIRCLYGLVVSCVSFF